MGLLGRGAAAALAVATGALLVGCGSSVADTDAPRTTRTTAPPSPFCAAARANSEALQPLKTLAGGGPWPENLDATVAEARRTGSVLLQLAPDEVRPAVERTVQAVNLQLDALVANGGDTAAMARDPELLATLGSPELATAGDQYSSYVSRTCRSTGQGNG